jgi:plasmid stabilization system protein ParE
MITTQQYNSAKRYIEDLKSKYPDEARNPNSGVSAEISSSIKVIKDYESQRRIIAEKRINKLQARAVVVVDENGN